MNNSPLCETWINGRRCGHCKSCLADRIRELEATIERVRDYAESSPHPHCVNVLDILPPKEVPGE